MRHWIRRSLDWAMTDLLHIGRLRPTEQAAHTRYEKAGLTLYGPPVPWNADALIVEILARLPPSARQRADFTLRLPGREQVLADAVRPDDADILYNLGTALLQLNRPAEARPFLERFVQTAPPRYAGDIARVREMLATLPR